MVGDGGGGGDGGAAGGERGPPRRRAAARAAHELIAAAAEEARGAERKPKRPKRRRKGTAMPSAVHYVGYVEDEETPEMIMKKFEALEAVKAAAAEKAAARRADAALLHGDVGGGARAGAGAGSGGNGRADLGNGGGSAGEAGAEGGVASRVADGAGPAPPSPLDEGLRDEHLVEVFKQTSMFSVKTAQLGGAFFEGGFTAVDGEQFLDLEFDDLVDEDEDEDFWGEGEGKQRKGRKRAGGAGRKATRPRAERPAAQQKKRFINFYNRDTGAFVRRHVKVVNPNAVRQFVVPAPPLSLGIGRRVKPFAPPAEVPPAGAEGTPIVVPSVVECVRGEVFKGSGAEPGEERPLPQAPRKFIGVLVSPGWEGPAGSGRASRVEPLRQLQLSKLCPDGFIFIWVQKTDIMAVMSTMYEQGFQYVENLTWVQLGVGNDVARAPSDYLCRSHATLFFFRHATRGRDIELRHQRSPDVTIDGVLSRSGRLPLPGESYEAIETLLPGGLGHFLELWAPQETPRVGWTRVLERLK